MDKPKEITLTDEVWKEIPDFPMYMVSNKGRIKTLKKIYYCGNHKSKRIESEHIISEVTMKDGYKRVSLSNNGLRKSFLVHRLVAKIFISNPNNLPQVNHKDEDKTNNSVDNLEWCDSKYNSNYGSRNIRASKSLYCKGKSKTIGQYTLEGKLIRIWCSATEAARKLGYNQGLIDMCCKGKRNKHKNYIWKYE